MVVAQETCPIILYGAPRSGTTFLNRILNEHPDIFISGETRIFLWAHASLNRLTRDPVNLFLHRDEIVDHLRAQYPRMIRDFYCGLNPEARYWGDKAPHYVSRQALGCLDTIADLFPETRFIQIVRDGRDVVASLVRKRTRDGERWTTFEGAHRTWTHALEIGCGFGRAQPPYRYFELRYEDLIRDEVGMARKLFDFLGIEIHPSVVDFCRRQREKRTPLSGPTRDLSGDAAASDWGTVLTPEEQLRSLEILGRHLIQFGYETEASLVEVYRAVAERRARAMVQPVGDAVSSTLPEDATVLVVDPTGGSLTSLAGRTVWPFPQTGDGACASPYLADGADAIAQLETLRAKRGRLPAGPEHRVLVAGPVRRAQAAPGVSVPRGAAPRRRRPSLRPGPADRVNAYRSDRATACPSGMAGSAASGYRGDRHPRPAERIADPARQRRVGPERHRGRPQPRSLLRIDGRSVGTAPG